MSHMYQLICGQLDQRHTTPHVHLIPDSHNLTAFADHQNKIPAAEQTKAIFVLTAQSHFVLIRLGLCSLP